MSRLTRILVGIPLLGLACYGLWLSNWLCGRGFLGWAALSFGIGTSLLWFILRYFRSPNSRHRFALDPFWDVVELLSQIVRK